MNVQPPSDAAGPAVALPDGFSGVLERLLDTYRPSRHPFFAKLASVPTARFLEPDRIGAFYHRYQAAMHATRVMVYFLPHLDTPALRSRKLQIYIDDDGLAGGDTHHDQLQRAFARMGARFPFPEDLYGELGPLRATLDPATAAFVDTVRELYARSLGAWCVTEGFSVDWLHALADGLAVHAPSIRTEPYFHACFSEQVEERHGAEALAIVEDLLAARPELRERTEADAARMAQALDQLWTGLEGTL